MPAREGGGLMGYIGDLAREQLEASPAAAVPAIVAGRGAALRDRINPGYGWVVSRVDDDVRLAEHARPARRADRVLPAVGAQPLADARGAAWARARRRTELAVRAEVREAAIVFFVLGLVLGAIARRVPGEGVSLIGLNLLLPALRARLAPGPGLQECDRCGKLRP
jgi:hypothetical protein